MALQAKFLQIVYSDASLPALAALKAGETEGLVAKIKLDAVSETEEGGVALLWKEKEYCLKLATEDVEIKSKVWDVVPGCTENCFARSGRKVESTTAACLYNFGYVDSISTGPNFKKTVAELFTDDSGFCFGDLPGLIVKVFINNFETNSFGGLYLWESAETMNNYYDGKTLVKYGEMGDLFIRGFISSNEQLCNGSFEKFSACNI